MAVKYQGGKAVPVSGEDVRRKGWLRQRELRLKDHLRVGEIDLAAQVLSEILESAMRVATDAMNKLRYAYTGTLITQEL